MPRFGIKSLLITFIVAALWLSTVAGYRAAYDVRAFVWLSVLVASGVAAISYDGRRRAFLIGFFITVLTAGVNGKPTIGVQWITAFLNACGQYQNLPNGSFNYTYIFLTETIRLLVVQVLATLMGFLGVLVYEHSQRTKKQ